MNRLLVAIAASALIVTGCSSASDGAPAPTDEGGSGPATEPPATDAPDVTDAAPAVTDPATTPATTPATSPATAPATDPPTTPAATDPPPAVGFSTDLAITEVGFDDHITITNLGSGVIDLDGLWLCNRPNYLPLPASTLEAGESIELLSLPTPPSAGEAALYSSNSFGDATAMIDYVAWGAGGGRAAVADAAGLWLASDTVPAGGTTITAPNGGASSADWSSS